MTGLLADVGGTRTKWALATSDGSLLERGVADTPPTGEDVIALVVSLARGAGVDRVSLAVRDSWTSGGRTWRRAAYLVTHDLDVAAKFDCACVELEVLTNDVAAAAAHHGLSPSRCARDTVQRITLVDRNSIIGRSTSGR